MFMAGSAWDDALRAVLPSVVVGLMMFGIMVGMTRRSVVITGQEVAALVVENGRCKCIAGSDYAVFPAIGSRPNFYDL